MHKFSVLKHVHLHYSASKCLLTGDTKNKPAWSHILKLAQRATVFFQMKQMGTINTPAPTLACTDALIHMHLQLSHRQSLLMQTQRPAVYTQKKQLQAINILACRGRIHSSTHAYGSTHKEIDTPAARMQRDRMSPTAVDSSKCKDRGTAGGKDGGIGGKGNC